MAKGTPLDIGNPMAKTVATPKEPEVFKPLVGEAMTKAKEANKGFWGAPTGQPAGIASVWNAPVAETPTVTRNDLALSMSGGGLTDANNNAPSTWRLYGTGGGSSDRGGYTTSGSGWGGNSSAGAGYGMGGRDRG